MADTKQATSGESIISRWSRRKLEAEQAPAVIEPAIEQAPAANENAVEKPLTDADMPDIESLTEASDFSLFMSSGVSDELRNLALRKLFRAPVFNIRDGLDEYDEDYTSFEKLGDIITCDMKHQIEVQQQKLREALEREREAVEAEGAEVTDAVVADDVEAIDDEGDAESDMVADNNQGEATEVPAADEVTNKAETGHE